MGWLTYVQISVTQLSRAWGVDDATMGDAVIYAPPLRSFQPTRRFNLTRVGDTLHANILIGAVGQTPQPANSSCPPPDSPIGWMLMLCSRASTTFGPCSDVPGILPVPSPPPGPTPSTPPKTTTPFCVNTNHGQFYIKDGGDPASRSGWDGGTKDKCCRDAKGSCRWFKSLPACEAALAKGSGNANCLRGGI